MFARCKKLACWFYCPLIIALLLIAWKSDEDIDWKWIQRCLIQTYDQSADGNLKKWELSITPQGFFRLRKYFSTGKQEYFSFNFNRLKDIQYNGTSAYGTIVFNTIQDNIIVQTYNDPEGNIDSMSTDLSIHVSNLDHERLDSLRIALLMFKH